MDVVDNTTPDGKEPAIVSTAPGFVGVPEMVNEKGEKMNTFSPSEMNRADRRAWGKANRMKILGVNKPYVRPKRTLDTGTF